VKAYNLNQCMVILFLILCPATMIIAQEHEAEEERKAVIETEMKARKQMLKAQKEQIKKMEHPYRESARENSRSREAYSLRESEYGWTFPLTPISPDPLVIRTPYNHSQSQLTLRKSFNGVTGRSNGEFDVEESVRHFRCVISGSVRTGEIQVILKYPDGKFFKDLTINTSADINYSQSISIKDGDEKKYIGSWRYEIKADEAEGNYMMQIMTN